MDKTEYTTNCEALLQEKSVYQHLSKDTFPYFQLSSKNSLKFLQNYNNNNFISETEYTQLWPHGSNSPEARFYGLPKIYKNNMPMCPTISACGTATYNTAKFITKVLPIPVARHHPLLKTVQISSRKLNISQTSRRGNLCLIWCQCSLYQHTSTCCTTSYQFQNFYLHQFHQSLQDPCKIHQASGIHFNQLHPLLQ